MINISIFQYTIAKKDLILSGPGFFGELGPGGRGGGGGGKCPRPITPKLFMVLEWNLVG